jgi:hypothetical protein
VSEQWAKVPDPLSPRYSDPQQFGVEFAKS